MSWIRNRAVGLVYYDPKLVYPGYTLFTSVRGYHATLLDMDGQIVHRWHLDEGIQHAFLLPNGHLLLRTLPPEDAGGAEHIGGSSAAILELDWDGNVLWEYWNPMLHHDYQRLPNGNTLILVWDKLPEGITEQVRGGHYYEEDPERMWGDVVQEITPDGEVVYEWRSWEYLNFAEDIICPLESRKEWTHANSVFQTDDGDILLSFRLTDTVGLVDRVTGKFKWKWGRDILSHQHHASLLDTGRVLIFDNGSHRRRGPTFSQVLEVDPRTNEITWSYKPDPVVSFYSFFVSGAERLPNGNTFIIDGAHGHLFEITPAGETVWEYVSPFMFSSSFGKTPAIFRAHRYPLTHPLFRGKDLNPQRYEALNRLIAHGLYPGEDPFLLDQQSPPG
jgi:hypothetical protein